MPAILSRPGIRDGNADPLELFKVVFTGEVLTAFETLCVFKGKNYLRTITEGKSARFDVLGAATAFYHTPGESLMARGQQIPADEFTITLDKHLVATVTVAEIDELMNHYDVRGKYAKALADELALAWDRNVAATGITAARSAAKIPGGDGGSVITDAAFATNAEAIGKGLYKAAQIFAEKNVRDPKRWFFCTPKTYYTLAQHFDYLCTLYGGTGSIREGNILKIAGFELVLTNNMPQENITTDLAKYNGDYSKTIGLCMTEEAVGTVQRQGLTVETSWEHDNLASLLSARFLVGHGVLRPECAIELATA